MAPREDEKSEEDVQEDDKVASSRAGKHGEDGSYVGVSSSDDAIDAGETGAEARGREKR
jgi:hypothetical protein